MERRARAFIIGRSLETKPLTDTAALRFEIESLLAALSAEEFEPSLTRLEDTLTTGYAHALALEAERSRLERRLRELANEVRRPGGRGRAQRELVSLAPRLSAADDELGHLRPLLSSLRARANAVRAAGAAG
jgi:hypothetical protein